MTLKKKYFGTKEFYIGALLLALPVMGQNLVQNFVTLIDNFMVAGLGDIKMSGTSIAADYIFVFSVLLNAVCMSGGIFLTQYFGAKDKHGMKQAVYFKSILGLIITLIYLFICLVIPRQALSLMVIGNSDAEIILDEGVKYMKTMSLVGIPALISYICSSSLKEIGEVKAPLIIAIGAALTNALFNYCLIYGHFGFPRLEVVGAAIATFIARTVEMICYLVYIKKIKAPFAIKLKGFLHVNVKLIKEMAKTSVMIIVSELIWALVETITTAVYNSRGGADVVSGMCASFTIANLYFVAFSGVNTAICVIIGKLLGEGKLEEAREKRRWLSTGSIIFSLGVMIVAASTSLLVPIIYSNLSLSAQNICEEMVFYMALLMPTWIILNVQLAISRSGGETKMGFILDGIVNIVVVVPLVIILAKYTNIGPVGIYIISKLVDVVKIIACYFYLKKETWLVNLTVSNN